MMCRLVFIVRRFVVARTLLFARQKLLICLSSPLVSVQRLSADELKGGNSVGAVKVGSMSKKFDVYVDPYFPRSVVLIGRQWQ